MHRFCTATSEDPHCHRRRSCANCVHNSVDVLDLVRSACRKTRRSCEQLRRGRELGFTLDPRTLIGYCARAHCRSRLGLQRALEPTANCRSGCGGARISYEARTFRRLNQRLPDAVGFGLGAATLGIPGLGILRGNRARDIR